MNSVSWPDFQMSVEEKMDSLERRMEAHEKRIKMEIHDMEGRMPRDMERSGR